MAESTWDLESIEPVQSTNQIQLPQQLFQTNKRLSDWDSADSRETFSSNELLQNDARPSDVYANVNDIPTVQSTGFIKRWRIPLFIMLGLIGICCVAAAVSVPLLLMNKTTSASTSTDTTTGSVTASGSSASTASTASTVSTASTASTASTSVSTASTASTSASTASTASTSVSTASTSASTASTSVSTASTASTSMSTASTSASTASTASTSASTASTVSTSVSTASTSASTASTASTSVLTASTSASTASTASTSASTASTASTSTSTTSTTSTSTSTTSTPTSSTSTSTSTTSTSTSTTSTTVASTTSPLVDPCVNGAYWNVTRTQYWGTGSSGIGLNQLNQPTGIFLDSNDNLYVADGGNYRVMKFAPNATSGISGSIVAGTTNVSGTALNLLSTGARYIFIDSSENLYVGDAYNNRVLRWANDSSNGTYGTIVAGNGTFGISLSEIYYPYGVWVDSSLNVFVAEYQNDRLTRWALGATVGTIVAGITSQNGNATNKLSSPAGLYYDETNQYLYIANSGTTVSTIMKWKIGDSNGTVIAGLAGAPGSNSSQLSSPMGITLDQWNNLYVADRSNSRIQFFCNGSRTGITIAGSVINGSGITAPYDVKLDSQMNLYVVDNSGNRVSKFHKL